MLKQRVLTALIIAPLIIWATLALPHSGFAFVSALIFVGGAWEWAGLSGLTTAARGGYAALLGALFALGYSFMDILPGVVLPVVVLGSLWWLVALLLVLRFPSGSEFWNHSRTTRALAGAFVLAPAWTGLVALHEESPSLALLVMFLVSFADIGAFFAGRAFGRHKLAPHVSPGKTWEGLVGALVVTTLVSVVALRWLQVESDLGLAFVGLCVATVLVSVLGDLLESMFKRIVGAKDSGHLLPGHGGVLDRIDSLTAAAPVFALGFYWLKVTLS